MTRKFLLDSFAYDRSLGRVSVEGRLRLQDSETGIVRQDLTIGATLGDKLTSEIQLLIEREIASRIGEEVRGATVLIDEEEMA